MHRRVVCAVALGAFLAGPARAQDATQEEIKSLKEQVAELNETVAALKAGQDPGNISAERAAQVRSMVNNVLADADTRASLLEDGSTAGYDNGFFLKSADGNFLLRIKGQLDFRWVLNNQANSPTGNDTVYGFEMRRAKIIFQGHVVDPSWEYKLQGAFNRNGGSLILEDAYIQKTFGEGVSTKFGQFKVPFLVEESTSSSRQLAVERSLVNEEFNQDFSKAVQAAWAGERFRVAAAYGDGFGSRDTAFDANVLNPAPTPAPTTANGVTGRVDWLIKGDWKQFEQFTSPRGSDFGARVGLAGHYQQSKYDSLVEQDFFTWTLDGAVVGDGWNIFAYFVAKYLDSQAVGVGSPDQYGIVLQGGWRFTDTWEAFGRYEWGTLDIPGQQDLSIATVGTNWYISGQNLKWTNDIGVAFNEVGAGWFTSGTGWRVDAPGEDGQVVVRSQFQLLF